MRDRRPSVLVTVLSDDEDDEAWLTELCRAPQQTATDTGRDGDEKAEEWLMELLLAGRGPGHVQSQAGELNRHGSQPGPQELVCNAHEHDRVHGYRPPLAGGQGQQPSRRPPGDMRQRPASSVQRRGLARSRSPRGPPALRRPRDRMQCLGDPEAMPADHTQMMSWLEHRDDFDIAGSSERIG